MPKYKVIEQGFHGGKIYKPNGKRPFLFTDKPLKKVPSWLKAVKAETAAQKKKRLEAEEIAAVADKKKSEEDQKAVDDMTFMGDGEKSSKVETL